MICESARIGRVPEAILRLNRTSRPGRERFPPSSSGTVEFLFHIKLGQASLAFVADGIYGPQLQAIGAGIERRHGQLQSEGNDWIAGFSLGNAVADVDLLLAALEIDNDQFIRDVGRIRIL